MGKLVRKELKSFFASLSGYVVLVFFLLANGLFLWIIPGGYHIPASGLADMQAFFTLAPLLYLFLVPALCMRLFAEERRTGTLELLLTRPLTTWQIVGAKYLAGFLLVLFSILPTLVYPVSLWFLAQPVGHIDVGGIIGSYIRHICGCRGLGFGFDRKSDYCFSLHPGGGFFVVYRSRLYSRYSFV